MGHGLGGKTFRFAPSRATRTRHVSAILKSDQPTRVAAKWRILPQTLDTQGVNPCFSAPSRRITDSASTTVTARFALVAPCETVRWCCAANPKRGRAHSEDERNSSEQFHSFNTRGTFSTTESFKSDWQRTISALLLNVLNCHASSKRTRASDVIFCVTPEVATARGTC